jgi:hypothetical protein
MTLLAVYGTFCTALWYEFGWRMAAFVLALSGVILTFVKYYIFLLGPGGSDGGGMQSGPQGPMGGPGPGGFL